MIGDRLARWGRRLWLYHLPFMVVFDGAYADVLFFWKHKLCDILDLYAIARIFTIYFIYCIIYTCIITYF